MGDMVAASFPVRVIAHAMRAAAAIPNLTNLGCDHFLPSFPVHWAAASWELQVAACAPVPRHQRANLYFHGWLHETSSPAGENL